MIDRRGFLSSFAGIAAMGSADFPSVCKDLLGKHRKNFREPSLYASNEEAYWAEIRKQFLIPEDEVYMNNGTVGSSPVPVLNAVFEGYRDAERLAQTDPEDYPIWGYASWNQFRDPLAKFVGCTRDELALVRNATEANSYIANGIDLKAGDEVLMTDQEHPGGEQPWNLRAKRYGIVVKKVTLPKPVPDAATVLNLFSEAITPRTRVLFFSHISTVTGVVLPAKELAALARSKGILCAVDGAHVPGMMKLNISEIGCDFYSSSPHKWLQAPEGHRISVCARRADRPPVEHHRDRRLGGQENSRGTFSAHRQFQRSGAVWIARGNRTGQSDRHGAHREAAPTDGRLHLEGDAVARRGKLDVSRSCAPLRNRHGNGGSGEDAGYGIVAVEGKENQDTRRVAVEGSHVYAVLFAAEGCGSFSGSLR